METCFRDATLIELAELRDPARCAAPELGMVCVLPGAGSAFQGLEHSQALQLLLRCLGEEFAPAPFAHHPVNLPRQVLWNDNVDSCLAHSKSHYDINIEWDFLPITISTIPLDVIPIPPTDPAKRERDPSTTLRASLRFQDAACLLFDGKGGAGNQQLEHAPPEALFRRREHVADIARGFGRVAAGLGGLCGSSF